MTQPPEGRPKPSGSTLIAGLLILILAVVTVVGAVTVFQLPNAITKSGDDVEILYQATLAISFFVFFIVASGIIWVVFRYRRRGPELPEQIHGSSGLELAWTIIPIIILVALFIPSYILVLDLKTPPKEDEIGLTVEAVGHQWWWEFIYPDDGIKIQQLPPNYDDLTPPTLVLPVDTVVVIKVRSTDVIHSFSVPETRYKVHAVPGIINQMHLTFTETGTFTGQCFQFCGLRHSDMLFILQVLSQEDYDQWLAATKQAQGTGVEDTSTTLTDSQGGQP